MLALVKNSESIFEKYPVFPKVRTTLYDMIEAVSEELAPGEEGYVAEVVRHIVAHGNVRFDGDYLKGSITVADLEHAGEFKKSVTGASL